MSSSESEEEQQQTKRMKSLPDKKKRKMPTDDFDQKKRKKPKTQPKEIDSEEETTEKKVKHKTASNDVDQGKTLFIRNLSFAISEEELKDKFLSYGSIVYAKIVKDPRTQHSRGMGFVKFEEKEDADFVLLRSTKPENDEEFTLDKRRINLTLAVSPERVKTFTGKEKSREEKREGRNLHLARVGMIRPGTQEAAGMSKDDVRKREDILRSKKDKLNNPSIFISPLRLCVRNLPPSVYDKQLLTEFKKLGGSGANITECRIMRDLNRVNSQGKGKSRGFAFVAFDDHDNAMKALQSANNRDVFGQEKKLIIEFSLENSKALDTRKRREIKSKVVASTSRDDNKQPLSFNEGSTAPKRPEKERGYKSAGQATLPKHFGVKNRRRDKAKKAQSPRKPKGKLSRKQKNAKQRAT